MYTAENMQDRQHSFHIPRIFTQGFFCYCLDSLIFGDLFIDFICLSGHPFLFPFLCQTAVYIV